MSTTVVTWQRHLSGTLGHKENKYRSVSHSLTNDSAWLWQLRCTEWGNWICKRRHLH